MAASTLVAGIEMRFNSVRRVSESQSEASSVTTEFSENDVAARLGIADSSNLKNAKIKVDRKKLEEMIQTAKANTFFESVMKDTTTHIYWPSHLKIDAKSKKDVHVKILGKDENVKIAQERVLEKLDARGSRVTMKMDISYNDHSSIIGSKGTNIKQIMDETSTHIHFPDSNKEPKEIRESNEFARRPKMPHNLNPYTYIEGMHNKPFPPKSNQVSLNGTLEGVERARAAVRYTSPLSISFEIPVFENQKPAYATDAYIERVKQRFDVSVNSKQTRQKLHSTTIMVKGTEMEAFNTQQATSLLINYLCDTFAIQTKVCLQMEISTQHHESIKGTNGCNLRQIMEETKTTIIFPDCRDGNTPQSKKSHVTIKGSIEGVYLAKQQLIGNLLVTLSFDYPEPPIDKNDIEALNMKYGVLISYRDKNNKSKCISIRGKEKFIDKIYEARHELLKLTTPLVKAAIPITYFSKLDLQDEFAFRQTLALMPNRSESPLTQHPLAQNFGSAFENLTPKLPRMQNFQNNRPRMLPNNFNLLSPLSNSSPRNSVSPITSGYNSAQNSSHNSFNSSTNSSMDVQGIFQQSQNSFLDACLPNSNATYYGEEKTPTLLDVKNFNFEQRHKGYLAMKRSLDGPELRTPTSQWSGLGLSKTSPFSLDSVPKTSDWDHHNEASPSLSPFGLVKTTGIVDTSSSNIGHHKDINSLLITLGLEHYIDTFHINEVDLELFTTLTPDNLTTLGIQAFGARKKLLMAINQLNASKSNVNRSTRFSGSAAPGAERRISGDW